MEESPEVSDLDRAWKALQMRCLQQKALRYDTEGHLRIIEYRHSGNQLSVEEVKVVGQRYIRASKIMGLCLKNATLLPTMEYAVNGKVVRKDELDRYCRWITENEKTRTSDMKCLTEVVRIISLPNLGSKIDWQGGQLTDVGIVMPIFSGRRRKTKEPDQESKDAAALRLVDRFNITAFVGGVTLYGDIENQAYDPQTFNQDLLAAKVGHEVSLGMEDPFGFLPSSPARVYRDRVLSNQDSPNKTPERLNLLGLSDNGFFWD